MDIKPMLIAEKDNYLNDKQKQVKQEIMEKLIKSLFGTLEENQDLFDNQAATDIVLSCLIMFSREVLIHFLLNSTAINIRKEFIEHYCNVLDKEIENELMKVKNNS